NKVEIFPSADPGAGTPPPTVNVKVTMTSTEGYTTSSAFTLGVGKPYMLLPSGVSDTANKTYAYSSRIHYMILDQNMNVLPENVLVNEKFTTSLVNDYPGTNWRFPIDCGPSQVCKILLDPNNWNDVVEGEAKGFVPTLMNPQSPLGATAVDHWSGTWGIGDGHPGKGVTVQTNTWQKYQDHARHTNIVSPSP
ncbi:MAG: hypothetical protein ACREDT_14270, partial [Methylocella sp.]